MKNLLFLLLPILLSGCRGCKDTDKRNVQPLTDCGPHSFRLTSEDTCSCIGGYQKVGDSCVFDTTRGWLDDWGHAWEHDKANSELWHSAGQFLCFDSCAILFKPAMGNFKEMRKMYMKGDNDADNISMGTSVPNFFPDPIKGDSIRFELAGQCFMRYIIVFEGRFNVANDTLKGRLRYRKTNPNEADQPNRYPCIFTKVKRKA